MASSATAVDGRKLGVEVATGTATSWVRGIGWFDLAVSVATIWDLVERAPNFMLPAALICLIYQHRLDHRPSTGA